MKKLFRLFNNSFLNLVFPLADFLHIFQLEEYDNSQYFQWCKNRLFKRRLQRVGELKWTLKAKVLYLISLVLVVASIGLITLLSPPLFRIPVLLAVTAANFFLAPFWLVFAKTLISPLERYLKFKQINSAKKKILSVKDLTVIAIAGSVGKTTTRHFLTQILKSRYKTFSPIGNYNTLLGISEEINTNMPGDCEVLVVELGEYLPGDLMRLAGLVKPQLLILTKVGKQHLEKFGSQEAIISEFCDLLSYPTIKKIFMARGNLVLNSLKSKTKVTIVDKNKWTSYVGAIKESGLSQAESTYENISLVASVSQSIGVKSHEIRKVVKTLTNVNQRLNVIRHDGITVIDDSYNISFESAKNAFAFMETFGGRKVLVSGGVVEQGKESDSANKEFGVMIAKTMDIVVLAKNNFSAAIANGIANTSRSTQVVYSNHPSQTPILLAGILKNGDVVLVQNELPEVYWH